MRDRRFLGVVLAGAVFLIAWWCLDFWFYAHGRIIDTPTYQDYGLKMRLDLVPYRDFAVEYPPGALPAFLVPAYFGQPTVLASYGTAFSRLMALCGLGLLGFVLLSRPPRRAIVFVAFCPLLVGYLIATRFDLWPALLVAGAVAAFVHDRHRLGWLALGFAFAAKLYAIVLLPLAIVWTLRRRGGSELAKGLAIWALAVAAAFLPFALIAPHGLWESLWGQLSRPLQIESTAASILTTFGRPTVVVSHGSASVAGYGWLAAATTGLEVVCLVVLWVAFARGPATEDRFVRHAAACVAAFIAFGQGPVAAVPHLARPARPARSGPPRPRRHRAARHRARRGAVLGDRDALRTLSRPARLRPDRAQPQRPDRGDSARGGATRRSPRSRLIAVSGCDRHPRRPRTLPGDARASDGR